MTLTGIAADSVIARGKGSVAGRRLTSLSAMLAGALIGALFVIHGDLAYALMVTVIVAATTWRLGLSNPSWIVVE